MTHATEFDFSLRGWTPDADAADAKIEAVKRKATLAEMGIAALDPYGSALMTAEPKIKAKSRAVRLAWVNRPTPRKDARVAGLKFYISDKRCPANHDSRRYTSTGMCVACLYLRGEARATARLRANL